MVRRAYVNNKGVRAIALGSGNTNCLTYIPNDIKLELDPLDVTVVGSPTVSNGVVSGFSSANYLTLPEAFSPGSNTWEYVQRIKFSNISAQEHFIGCRNHNFPLVKLYNSKFMMYVSSNGSSWNVASEKVGTFVPTANTYYWIKLRFTGSAYILSYSTNGSTFTDDITVSSTATIKGGSNIVIGNSWTDRPLTTGTVDLTQSYIKINNKLWWQGGTGKLTLKKNSKVYVPNGWTNYKYYKYTYANWTQPVLTANGTVGGSSYAVRVSTEYTSDGNHRGYRAFDDSKTTQWEANVRNTSQWIEFYSPVELKVSSINFVNRHSSSTTYTKWKLTVSNNGTNYTTIKTFDTGSPSNGASWSVNFDIPKGYKYFKFSIGDGGALIGSNAKPSFAEITLNAKEVTGSVESTSSDYDYKVGSGSMIFDEVVTSRDISIHHTHNDTRMWFIRHNSDNDAYSEGYPVTQCLSGSTASAENKEMFWYDTSSNIIKRTSDTGATWDNYYSFPLCIYTNDGSGITSIDQVFNGFGYIGSTVYALPGVKGLAANGFNEGGTYKSVEFTISNPTVFTNPWEVDGNLYYGYHYDSKTISNYFKNELVYDGKNNLISYKGVVENICIVAGSVTQNGGKITSLTPNKVQPEKTTINIPRVYEGSNLIWGYDLNQVLFESSTAGTYTVDIEFPGKYQVIVVGGGSGAAYNVSGKFSDGSISGGSGAGFEGIISLTAGTYTITVGAGGTSVSPHNANTAKPGAGGNSSIGNLIIAGGGNEDGTANAGFRGSGNVISKGGVLRYTSSIVDSINLASNGIDGGQGWNTAVTGASSVFSGQSWGEGGTSNYGNMTNGKDGYVLIATV